MGAALRHPRLFAFHFNYVTIGCAKETMGWSTMRLPPGLLNGLAKSFQSIAARASFVPGALDFTYRAAIKTIVLLVSFILLYVVVKYVRADDVMIEPISVPPKLQEAGYSGVVVANLLLQEVQAIKRAGDELETAEMNSEKTPLRAQSNDPFASLATIQVPSSGLSVRTIADVLRDFLDIRERKIGGAITIVTSANATLDRPGNPAVYQVALDLGPTAALAAKPEAGPDIEKAIRLSARSIVRQYDPVGLASYYVRKREQDALRELADDLMKSDDRWHRRAGLFVQGLYADNAAEKIARFQEAIAEDPEFGAAYNALGSALAATNEGNDEAIRMFGEAIRLNPSNVWAYRNRADVYRRKGDFQRAVADFERASKLRAIAKIFFELGYAYEFMAEIDPSPAIRAYDEAIRLEPHYRSAFKNRCYMRAVRGDKAAVEDCDKAVADDSNFNSYDSRGFAYLRQRQFDKAIVDYDAAIAAAGREDNLAYPLYGRGVARLALGELARGNADIEAARGRDPNIDKMMGKFGVKASDFPDLARRDD